MELHKQNLLEEQCKRSLNKELDMKQIQLLILLLTLLTNKAFGQDSCDRLRFVLLIDGRVPVANVYESWFEVKDGASLKKIPFNYEVGSLSFSDNGYKELKALGPDTEVVIRFRYHQFEPKSAELLYEKSLKAGWLNQQYLILTVYNYSNKANKRAFSKREGYGIEISTASFSTVLPRRK